MSRASFVKHSTVPFAALCALALLIIGRVEARQSPAAAAHDWRQDWETEEGLALHIDAEGFQLPTAIAAVPNPGARPEDPLYFVTELRGAVKVVTNNRQVHTFADGFVRFRPARELPALEGESGLAGICLDPVRGYVFVTFLYEDDDGVLRNDVVRFQSTPGTFSVQPTGRVSFTALFAPWKSTISHQVGSCRVSGEHLFVSLGDGRQTRLSQDTTALLGKILRLTLDGRAAPGNPFRPAPLDTGVPNGAAAVWAYGFRNPFGMTVVDGQPYVADNGSGIDRFLLARRGENYLWDGTDRSIALRGDVVLSPSVGPAHVEYVPDDAVALPEPLRRQFYLALSAPHAAGVLGLPYDVQRGSPAGTPRYLLRYRGASPQIVSGVALARDGLYVVPILPDASGRTAVLRLNAATGEDAHPYVILENRNPAAIMEAKACRGCHVIGGEGGRAAPTLDRDSLVPRLQARLFSEEYRQQVATVDALEREPFVEYRGARARVLEAQGYQRLLTWTRYKLLEPRFDNPNSQMPNPGLTQAEAEVLARELLGTAVAGDEVRASAIVRLRAFLRDLVPRPPRVRHLALAALLGTLIGTAVGWTAARRMRRTS